jgi:hypothetical protein
VRRVSGQEWYPEVNADESVPPWRLPSDASPEVFGAACAAYINHRAVQSVLRRQRVDRTLVVPPYPLEDVDEC